MSKGANIQIERQVQLPLSKAFKISMDSIRIRLWRSMITAGGIFLGIAFLSSVLITTPLEKAASNEKNVQMGYMRKVYTLAQGGHKLVVDGSKVFLDDQPAVVDKDAVTIGTTSVPVKDITDKGKMRYVAYGGVAISEKDRKEAENSGARRIWLVVMSLLVCTVGIANAMLMSVTERFKEIGTMKCLGALDRFIVTLFLLEAMFLGIIASFLGALVGFVAMVLVYWAQAGFIVIANLRPLEVLAVLGICLGIGTVLTVVATAIPARRAATIPPAAALRSEI